MKRSMILCAAFALWAAAGHVLAQGDEAQQEAKRAQMEAARAQLEAAREQLREAARQVAELSREVGERTGEAFVYEFIADENRGMIGVVLSREGEDLKIASVTPGSPAEEAGIEAGDVVVAVNGEPVTLEDKDRHFRTPEGLRGLSVGDEVTLTLSGESGEREVTVAAARRDAMAFAPAMHALRHHRASAPPAPGMPGMDREIRHKVHEAMARVGLDAEGAWHRVELAPVNPELGRYFGTSEGVLVINVADDHPLGLKPGDVILRIGDRVPNSPHHAFRIVRTYGRGETIEVEVLRDGERHTLTHELGDHDMGWVPGFAPEAFAWGSVAP